MLTDARGRTLLFHVLTPDKAPDGWMKLPSSGIDPGGAYLEPQHQGVQEEAGLVLEPAQVSQPGSQQDGTVALAPQSIGSGARCVVQAQVADEQPAGRRQQPDTGKKSIFS